MSQLSEFEEELLSGYLDGQLSSAELHALRDLLARNSDARARLKVLGDLVSGIRELPTATLGADFSSRVIARARQEAVEARLPSSHHVLLDANSPIRSKAGRARPSGSIRRWHAELRWVGGITALAASLLVIAFLTRHTKVVRPLPLISSADSSKSSSNTATAEFATKESVSEKSPLSAAIEDSLQVASVEPATKSELPVRPPAPLTMVDMNQAAHQMTLLMVVDVMLSKTAWQEGAFDKVLEMAGIAIREPIVADSQLQKTVADSLVIVKNPPAGTDSEKDGRVAILLVHSDAKSLDKAMVDLYSRPLDFPELSFNIAYAPADKSLFDRLNKEAGLAVDTSSDQLWARPIVVKDERFTGVSSSAQFLGSGKRTNLISSDRRNKGWPKQAADVGEVSMNPRTQTLFVIRQSSEAR